MKTHVNITKPVVKNSARSLQASFASTSENSYRFTSAFVSDLEVIVVPVLTTRDNEHCWQSLFRRQDDVFDKMGVATKIYVERIEDVWTFRQNFHLFIMKVTSLTSGPRYSLSERASYCKISWVTKPRDSGLDFSNRPEIWQAPRH